MNCVNELIEFAKTAGMTKKHAAAVFIGRQLISLSTNIRLHHSEENYRMKRCQKEG